MNANGEPASQIDRRLSPNQPSTPYERSFMRVRFAIGVLGAVLPLGLTILDRVLFDGPVPRTSVSSYYYSGVREFFVGGLCAIGVFLVSYKIASHNLDNLLSAVAGAFVLIVAIFPTGLPTGADETPLQDLIGPDWVERIHYGAAVVFITSLVPLSWRFGNREGGSPPRPGQRLSPRVWMWFHRLCAIAIGAALVWIGITELTDWGPNESLYYGELAAVVAFGASWLAKGAEFDILFGRR